MSNRRWVVVALSVTTICCLVFMGVNFHMDEYAYFAIVNNKLEGRAPTHGYARLAKAKYVKENKNQYNAVILGGSKAGALRTETADELTGLRFYNFHVNVGCFRDYAAFASYCITTMDLEEIILHLSSVEANRYSYDSLGANYRVPAMVAGKSEVGEYLSFLTMNGLRNVVDLFKKLTGLEDNEGGDVVLDAIDGERVLEEFYKGMMDDALNDNVTLNFSEEMDQLFSIEKKDLKAHWQSVAALERIKQLCDDNGVRLTVVIGPDFLPERHKYECEEYYDYIKELVQVTDLYDFSDFNAVNLNPYNYIDHAHYWYEVGDNMLRYVYGRQSFDDFGKYLTKDNVEEYIQKRRSDYNRLKEEYETTGTIELYGREDASNMHRE